MAFLAVLQPDPRTAARLIEALSPRHGVVAPSSWSELELLLATETVDGCVVDVDHPTRGEALQHLRRLRGSHPELAIVAVTNLDGAGSEAFDLGANGVDALLPADERTNALGTRNSIQQALDGARAAQVGRSLRGRLDDDALRALVWSVEHARSAPTAADLADAMVRTPRALADLLRTTGLPPAGRLLLWGRLLQAAAGLGRDGLTVEEAAYAMGYSTASALARAMKRETGLTPGEVTRRGGLPTVLNLLLPRGGMGGKDMGKSFRIALMAMTLLTGWGCATAGRGSDRAGGIDAVLDRPPVHQVHFGVLAVEAATGRVLYERNAHRKFIPASNQKVLVTATALSLLGPDYRYRTGVHTAAPLVDGVVGGDLVVVGRGDPTLSARYWDTDGGALAALADSLWAAGVRRVEGEVVVDVAAWDSTTIGDTWEVADLPWRYAATGGAFAVDEGELGVIVRGGFRPGEPPVVTWTPLGEDGFVDASALVTVPPDSSTRVRASYLPETHRVVLTGHVAARSIDSLRFAQRDPVRQAGAAFHRALRRRGIDLDGGVRVAWDTTAWVSPGCRAGRSTACAGSRPLATLVSPPLSEIVAGILEPSQNWMTEQLVRTLGAERGARGSWSEGLDVVHRFLVDEVGVDSLDVAPRDGSGLSAYNLVTPRALVAVFRFMAAGPHAAAYRTALAEPGEEGSTLSRRLEGLESRLFAKTGTISNVNSLSGYLVGNDGTEIIFSILSNGSGLPSSTVRDAIDDVVRILAR